MANNLIFLWISVLCAVVTIIFYFIEFQKRVKYPLLTIFGSLCITSLLVLFFKSSDKADNNKIPTPIVERSDTLNPKKDSVIKAVDTQKENEDSSYIVVNYPLKENYYYSNFYDYKIIFLRSRSLTKEEINICNQCLTYSRPKDGKPFKDGGFSTNEETIYENMNTRGCQLKKKLDDETGLGYISTGVLVELLETKGNFSHIKVLSNGVSGWISSKLQGKPTLVKALDETVPSAFKLQEKAR
jgi:hypothetical protein